MRNRIVGAAMSLAMAAALPLSAGAAEVYFPSLVYRSGAYAPNGIPWANGISDYIAMLNERDGGIEGAKIVLEECETGYATDRGVECYERLKGMGTGAAAFSPLSTGITFALTEKAPGDRVPLLTLGYGRSESVDGRVFQWNFPLLGTYWDAASILLKHVDQIGGGLKGKKITLLYHDSPYGKEPIPVLQGLAEPMGYTLEMIPVTSPGVEQKAAWLQIRRSRPDYVFLWGWGVMNSTAIKEAVAVGYPRDKMYGVWWAAAEPDVRAAGADAKGYQGLALNPSGQDYPVIQEILKHVYDKGKGSAKREEVGEVLYNRGMINAMLTLEAVRTAMKATGSQQVSGAQVRDGFEHLNLTAEHIKDLGFEGLVSPLQVSCMDHGGARKARVHQWDGQKWVFTSDWIESDTAYLRPKMEEAAAKYAAEKGIKPAACG